MADVDTNELRRWAKHRERDKMLTTAAYLNAAADELDALRAQVEGLERYRVRCQWIANEVLACDYGDNDADGKQIGWTIGDWSNKHSSTPRRIYGSTIDAAIDAAIGGKG